VYYLPPLTKILKRNGEESVKYKTLYKLILFGSTFLLLCLLVVNSSSPAAAQDPTGGFSVQAVVSTAFIYQGQLSDTGGPVTGTCDFTFKLFDAATNGVQIGADVNANNTTVTNGSFSVELDFGDAFTGDARYLEVTVDCGSGPTLLSPRQELKPVPYALGLRPGAKIEGTGAILTGVTTGSSGNDRGLFGQAIATSGSTTGVRGETASTDSNAIGVYGLAIDASATGSGVKGQNNGTAGYGVWGQGGANATGVLGQTGSTDGYGVWALNTGAGIGLRAESQSGNIIEGWDFDDAVNSKFEVSNSGQVTAKGGLNVSGGANDSVTLSGADTVLAVSTSGSGSRAISGSATGAANPAGVYGESSSTSGRGVYGNATSTSGANAGVRGETASVDSNATGVFGLASSASATGSGVKGQNNGTAGYGVWGQGGGNATGVLGQTGSASDYGVWAYNSGTGVALRAEGGGNLIEAWDLSPVNVRFRVDNNGNVTADGTYTSPAADFAEMLPAGDGLEPGDVLVIGLDGNLAQSAHAYQPTVVGVYSSKPGFVGGVGINEEMIDKVPLAVVGIVPVKASAENGAIQPGDLLVASDTPGHAMRAGSNPPNGAIIGKALAGLDEDTGVIQMLVILQ
jgi:hypothetical protein